VERVNYGGRLFIAKRGYPEIEWPESCCRFSSLAISISIEHVGTTPCILKFTSVSSLATEIVRKDIGIISCTPFLNFQWPTSLSNNLELSSGRAPCCPHDFHYDGLVAFQQRLMVALPPRHSVSDGHRLYIPWFKRAPKVLSKYEVRRLIYPESPIYPSMSIGRRVSLARVFKSKMAFCGIRRPPFIAGCHVQYRSGPVASFEAVNRHIQDTSNHRAPREGIKRRRNK
jgi:hypothetical protein